MAYNIQYKIFVSSPGDVAGERSIVDDVVAKINNAISDTLGIFLSVEKWERIPPESTDEELQERLNKKIKDCHFFLLILNRRYGTIVPGHTISNTEREINTIIENISKDKKKKILSYFKEFTPSPDAGPQEEKIMELKKRLRDYSFWFYKEFKDENDFENKLTHDLYQILIRMKQASFKVEQLKKFWLFGKLDNQVNPKALVVYPPVPREWMGMPECINLWQRRLLPNIFFEDFKALHKILKNLAMVGLGEYKVYSKFDLPQDFDKSNIIWICLPRQKRGLNTLKSRNDKNFDIIPRNKKHEPIIRWKDKDGTWVNIKSPLIKYIEQQRPYVDPEDDWNKSLGNIVARDYAIIARFNRIVQYNETPGMDKLKEYYLTGIHGLGTWGAAWYIDRFYGRFMDSNIEDMDSVQILVEVEYCDGRINYVKDVSDFPAEYFEEQQKLVTVKRVIKEYNKL